MFCTRTVVPLLHLRISPVLSGRPPGVGHAPRRLPRRPVEHVRRVERTVRPALDDVPVLRDAGDVAGVRGVPVKLDVEMHPHPRLIRPRVALYADHVPRPHGLPRLDVHLRQVVAPAGHVRDTALPLDQDVLVNDHHRPAEQAVDPRRRDPAVPERKHLPARVGRLNVHAVVYPFPVLFVLRVLPARRDRVVSTARKNQLLRRLLPRLEGPPRPDFRRYFLQIFQKRHPPVLLSVF